VLFRSQFASAVSLPTFQDGDVFRDGAGNEFPIISINDGLDTVTIAIGRTVNTSLDNLLSGSIYRLFEYIFGENVLVGTTADASATNIAGAINTQLYVSALAVTNVITLTSGITGGNGNTIRLSKDDAGQDNFTLSGTNLTGGLDGDIVAIAGVQFKPVIGPAGNDNEFEVDVGSLNNTLANLEDQINSHPSLIGVVTSSVLTAARSVQISAAFTGAAGNLITLQLVNDSSGQIAISANTLLGGVDNKAIKSFNGAAWITRVPDSDMIFFIGVSSDGLVVVSKAGSNGNQILPQVSLGGAFTAGLGKRYYSDESELSFTITTRSPNSFILGGDNVDIFGKGINAGSSIRVDQFILRTSSIEDDITNLRASEVPVLEDNNLKLNLLGGVD
jgi:hypothetical protein